MRACARARACECLCVCVYVCVCSRKEYCHSVLGYAARYEKNELYVSQSINIHFLENNIVLV